MKNTTRISLVCALALFSLGACDERKESYTGTQAEDAAKTVPNDSVHKKALEQQAAAEAAGKEHVATILQRKDAPPYAYLEVEENGNKYWVAGPPTDLKEGTSIRFVEQIWMENFASKSLNRTFDKILFVGAIDAANAPRKAPVAVPGPPSEAPTQQTGVSVPSKLSGTFTVAELFSKRLDLKGKKIAIRGKVLKVNKGIMGKDWVTLSDGTGTGAGNKLSVTTPKATVAVGDKIVAVGVVAVDQDLGFGYFYPVLLEHAVFKK